MSLSSGKNYDDKSQPHEGKKKTRHPPLKTGGDVRRELSKLYFAGKQGERDISDVSKLANVLGILGRMVQGEGLEERIAELERRVSK